MLSVIILLIILASPAIAAQLGYDLNGWILSKTGVDVLAWQQPFWSLFSKSGATAGGPVKCGAVVCAAPTPVCYDLKCVACQADVDCPMGGARIVHGYSLDTGGKAPDVTIDADSHQKCVIAALNGNAAAAQYLSESKKCELYMSNAGLSAVAPADPTRTLIEVSQPIVRK